MAFLRLLVALLAAAALLPPAASRGAERPFDLSLGVDYSSGEYGESTSTDILFLPVSLKYETGRLTLKAVVPYLRITTAGNVVGGGADVVVTDGVEDGDRQTESGLGDISLSASWFLYGGSDALPMADVTARVKFPTADEEKGLGTGAADLTFEADLTKVFDRSFLFLTAGYKIYGDPDDGELDNVLLGSVGFGRRLSPRASAGIIYDARQAASPEGSAASEVTGYLGYRISDRFRVMPYFVKGLSDGSPDFGAGLSFTTSFAVEDLGRIIPSLEHPRR